MSLKYTGNLTNISNPVDVFTNANNVLNGWIGGGIVFGLFLLLLFVMARTSGSAKQAFAGSSVITAIVSFLLWGIGWVGLKWFIVFVVCSIVGAIWLYHSGD